MPENPSSFPTLKCILYEKTVLLPSWGKPRLPRGKPGPTREGEKVCGVASIEIFYDRPAHALELTDSIAIIAGGRGGRDKGWNPHLVLQAGRRFKGLGAIKVLAWIWQRIYADTAGARPF